MRQRFSKGSPELIYAERRAPRHSADNQDRDFRVRQHFARLAPQQHRSKSFAAVRGHQDEVERESLIEMIHHVAQKGAEGANVHFLRRHYLTVNTHAVLPWAGALIAMIGGFFAFRFTWPTVANAWNNALLDAQRSSK